MINQETIRLLDKILTERERNRTDQDVATDCVQDFAELIISLTKIQYDPNPLVNLYPSLSRQLVKALSDVNVIAAELGLKSQEVNEILSRELNRKK